MVLKSNPKHSSHLSKAQLLHIPSTDLAYPKAQIWNIPMAGLLIFCTGYETSVCQIQ